MADYGSLETQSLSDDVRDIRGTTVRGSDGEKLGAVDDVIFLFTEGSLNALGGDIACYVSTMIASSANLHLGAFR